MRAYSNFPLTLSLCFDKLSMSGSEFSPLALSLSKGRLLRGVMA